MIALYFICIIYPEYQDFSIQIPLDEFKKEQIENFSVFKAWISPEFSMPHLTFAQWLFALLYFLEII